MATLYMMIGPPSSGKSTWAKNFFDNRAVGHFIYISRDDIRNKIVPSNESLFSRETEVFSLFCKKIAYCLDFGYNVIADATHINYMHRMKVIDYLKQNDIDFDIIFVVMNTPYKTCVERDNKRTGREHVGAEEIWEYYKVFTIPKKEDYPKCKEVWIIQ